MRLLLLSIYTLLSIHFGYTQASKNIDILHYHYKLRVSDTNDTIYGLTEIQAVFKNNTNSISLDLENADTKGGMLVEDVSVEGSVIMYSHTSNRIAISIAAPQDTTVIRIKYKGVPKDGLVIAKNKFGDRTFFGDNWPNRAHQWLPCIDHPSEKAIVAFSVEAPDHYQVVGNGILKEISNTANGKLHRWETQVPIPSKVMVVGIARFAVEYIGKVHQIPMSTWVYPQNKNAGFYDYAQAKEILQWFIDHIAPYPYGKLANVQSKTRFGGMENASNIFYYENSVTGKRKAESLLAHEIAHQWFGNSATESNWSHLWLSEGFATYFTNLYMESKYGKEKLKERMQTQRQEIIAFSKKRYTPVIDTQTKNLMQLLNANSYQKGGWFLHMLRMQTGDEVFWEIIKDYYQNFQLANADTEDFKKTVQQHYDPKKNYLDTFFQQWLSQAGHPILQHSWNQEGKQVSLQLQQKQNNSFVFPLEIAVHYLDGSVEKRSLYIVDKKHNWNWKSKKKIKDIVLDPEVKLLFEE
ncbi:MAG: M1 family metallopeptidase [Flavobacteriaceae bacterium]|nr:M1 family metallopeptidase [Flavobacteriaceae bacterium]